MAITITKPTVGGSEDTWGDTINTALDTIVDAVNGTSGTTAPNLTEGSWQIDGTAITPSAADLNVLDGLAAQNVSVAEIGHLDGVTSDIQTQLDSKQATITGAATTIDTENLTANRALISNGSGKVAVSSTITTTELGYLNSVTSNIQTQLNGKAALSGANFTGAVDVNSTMTANKFALDNGSSDWTFEVSSNNLIIKYAGTAKMKLDTSGNLTVTGNVDTNGTI